jgi:hypothetical protein
MLAELLIRLGRGALLTNYFSHNGQLCTFHSRLMAHVVDQFLAGVPYHVRFSSPPLRCRLTHGVVRRRDREHSPV